ncbi:hypothetical protein HMPREF1979_03099 [Actinomyces johnsonii F0542]|uniref:Uncharacterized protein n=1 Tax=Actinomyces johnsonii F0542 TaxID=1321818 RepID=U1RPF7_9ACTO|nr:hypothetical protein HMPREF1979_03099 [Actinomyces johnsonii F0542]
MACLLGAGGTAASILALWGPGRSGTGSASTSCLPMGPGLGSRGRTAR